MNQRYLFTIPNLSAQAVAKGQPWLEDPTVPEGITKSKFYDWCKDKATNHCFVSGFEGIAPTRINAENTLYKQHALIADYDASHTMDQVREQLDARCLPKLKPAIAQITLSGNVRLIWFLSEPVQIPEKLGENYLGHLVKELNLNKLLAGLDDNITKASQYFCWYGPTVTISDDVISSDLVWACISKSASANRRYSGEGGVIIPLDVVKSQVEKKYPGRWLGDFDERSRGVCFWDATAKNTSAAQVTKTGMLAFSQDRPFYDWETLFGTEFVKQYQQAKLARPMEDYYFGSHQFWSKPNGVWIDELVEEARASMQIRYGLSMKPPSETLPSEVNVALYNIRINKRVAGVIPSLYDPRDIVRLRGSDYLNNSSVKVCQPCEVSVDWGEGFPFLSEYYDKMFTDGDALKHLLAWMKRFYESAYEGDLSQGQAVFIAGGAGKGKTLWSTQMMGALMGGNCDASEYLTDDTKFNKELFNCPIWNVDDSSSNTTFDRKSKWTNMIKKAVANTTHPYTAKYQDTLSIPWTGRVIVTLNDDPIAMEQIPRLVETILDKLMLFHANGPQVEFPTRSKLEGTIRAETPFFARWLLDMPIPEEVRNESRFGIKPYHGVNMVEHAMASDPISGFSELVDKFVELRHANNPNELEWCGNATALVMAMDDHETLKGMTSSYRQSSVKMGQSLKQLLIRGGSPVKQGPSKHKSTQWIIDLRERLEDSQN